MKIPANKEFPSHPGGQTTLALARDQDSIWDDSLFLIAHLGCDQARVAKTAKHLGLGDLPKRGKLYDDIHTAILKIKRDNPNAVWVYRIWCLFITFTILSSMVLILLTGQKECVIVLSASLVTYAFNIFHMRNHRGGIVYGIGWLDRLTRPLYEVIDRTYMYRPEKWRLTHNGKHHMDTNSITDDDVNNAYKVGIRAVKHKPHRAIHEYQHIYTHLLLSINLFAFPIKNWLEGGSFFYFALHYTTFYIIPYYRHGGAILQTALLATVGASAFISHLFQVSHNHEGLGAPDDCHRKAAINIDDFIKLQIMESISWGGFVSNLLFGGINYQVEHHIAPCLCPAYYHFLSIELEEIARLHNIPYIKLNSFPDALVSYHRHLYNMGRKELEGKMA